MPIFSYLAYPKPGEKNTLIKELANLEYCETLPSDNQEIVILVTNTPDEDNEKKLAERLKMVESLQSLSMTFGHIDS